MPFGKYKKPCVIDNIQYKEKRKTSGHSVSVCISSLTDMALLSSLHLRPHITSSSDALYSHLTTSTYINIMTHACTLFS